MRSDVATTLDCGRLDVLRGSLVHDYVSKLGPRILSITSYYWSMTHRICYLQQILQSLIIATINHVYLHAACWPQSGLRTDCSVKGLSVNKKMFTKARGLLHHQCPMKHV